MHAARLVLIFVCAWTSLIAEPSVFHPETWAMGTEFPDKPKESFKKTKTAKGDMIERRALLERKGEVFGAELTIFPMTIPVDSLDRAYDGGKRGMQKTRPGEILEEEKILICGLPGRRYVVKYNGGHRISEHRVVFVGNELYQFIYERPLKTVASPASETFFAKIRLSSKSK